MIKDTPIFRLLITSPIIALAYYFSLSSDIFAQLVMLPGLILLCGALAAIKEASLAESTDPTTCCPLYCLSSERQMRQTTRPSKPPFQRVA